MKTWEKVQSVASNLKHWCVASDVDLNDRQEYEDRGKGKFLTMCGLVVGANYTVWALDHDRREFCRVCRHLESQGKEVPIELEVWRDLKPPKQRGG